MNPYEDDPQKYLALYRAGLTPLVVSVASLTWVLYDYLLTLEDEIIYIWHQPNCRISKIMFLWIRYYTIILLIFDTTQIHLFKRHGITNNTVCVAMDIVTRVIGAISLWSVEVVMQLRIYALYSCSRRFALLNGAVFLCSLAGFFYVLVYNADRRREVIKDAIEMPMPLPGCPSIHTGIEWAQWVPATAFEFLLFGEALYQTLSSTLALWDQRKRIRMRLRLHELILRDHILWFASISILLVLNNLMVVGKTRIPWFSYTPFHAAMGILTARMLIGLRRSIYNEQPILSLRTISTHSEIGAVES